MAQTAWFAAPASRRFAHPLDGGLTLRGRRLFGEQQDAARLRRDGAGRAAALRAPCRARRRSRRRVRPVAADARRLCAGSARAPARLHGWRAAELVRQAAARHRAGRRAARGRARGRVQFAVDRLDSGLGMLLAVSAWSCRALADWPLVLAGRPVLHWAFSVADVPPRPEGRVPPRTTMTRSRRHTPPIAVPLSATLRRRASRSAARPQRTSRGRSTRHSGARPCPDAASASRRRNGATRCDACAPRRGRELIARCAWRVALCATAVR